MSEHRCHNQQQIEELKQEVKEMHEELHQGDLQFQKLDLSLKAHGKILHDHGVFLQNISKQTEQNLQVLKTIRWCVISVIFALVAMKVGLLDFLEGIVL